MGALCGAKSRQGTPCRRPAGWGTDHPGTGRCKLHGGCSPGGPPSNKKALATGEHEAIWFDVLPKDERKAYRRIATDKIKQLDDEIRLLTIRERRMLQRIESLKQKEFTLVEYTESIGTEKGEDTELLTEKREATLGQIQRIEEALTRVQLAKTRAIHEKHEIEAATGNTGDQGKATINRLVDQLTEAETGASASVGQATQEHSRS